MTGFWGISAGWLVLAALTAAEPPSPADFAPIRAAFVKEQERRKEYTGTIRARLTVYSPMGGSETFPEMIRRIRDIEGGVCRQSAVWADRREFNDQEEVSKRCADLTSEFSGIEIEQVLGLSGYRPEPPARSRKRVFTRAGRPGLTCIESTDVRVEVGPGSDHPTLIHIAGGHECSGNRRGLFRDGSSLEARYALSDGVWQITNLIETHRAPFESHDVMTEVEFFFRTFKAKGRLREPMIRIEKAFSDYRRIDRARKLVANPVEGELKEDSEISIKYELDGEAKPESGEQPKKKDDAPKPAKK